MVADPSGAERIELRWVTQLALSFDHRLPDGQLTCWTGCWTPMEVSIGGALWGMKCLVPDPNSREMTVSPIPGTGIDVPVPRDVYFGAGIHCVYEYMEADGIQVLTIRWRPVPIRPR